MTDLETRVRRLEQSLVLAPSADEYQDAQNREQARALHVLAERVTLHGFDSGYLFPEETLRMLAKDTPERQAKDQEIIDAWCKAHGKDRAAQAAGAKEKLLAMLEARAYR